VRRSPHANLHCAAGYLARSIDEGSFSTGLLVCVPFRAPHISSFSATVGSHSVLFNLTASRQRASVRDSRAIANFVVRAAPTFILDETAESRTTNWNDYGFTCGSMTSLSRGSKVNRTEMDCRTVALKENM